MNATVSMTVDEWTKFQDHIKLLEAKNKEYVEALTKAVLVDPSGRVPGLTQLSRSLMTIIQFAVANLSPRDIKRWPFASLRDIASKLEFLPDFSTFDEEFKTVLLSFASECEEWEKKRAATVEKEIPPPFPIEQHPVVRLHAGLNPTATVPSEPGNEIKTDPSAA